MPYVGSPSTSNQLAGLLLGSAGKKRHTPVPILPVSLLPASGAGSLQAAIAQELHHQQQEHSAAQMQRQEQNAAITSQHSQHK